MSKEFPDNFIWGAATSAYQIEGGASEDGKGDSVWDTFCRQPGRVYNNHTGDVACDHYNRFEEDFYLMQALGMQHYRFSFAWTRLLPEGTGAVNMRGIDFYNRMIDSMLAHNITPHATLFHWDYPYELFRRGGWLNDDSSEWFAEYTGIIAKHFGDRVKHFFTLNEPQCFIGISLYDTHHAPGIRFPAKDCLIMAHNTLLSHGKSVQVLRAGVNGAVIGYAPTGRYYHPYSTKQPDIEAARAATFDCTPEDWAFSVSWWSDPVMLGSYPQKAQQMFGNLMPSIKTDDMKIISQPIDIYAQNIYHSQPVKASGEGYEVVPFSLGHPKAAFQGWPVTPECMYWPLRFLDDRYKTPLMITENGISALDCVSLDGRVHDATRIDYLQKHLISLHNAIRDGVDIRGYFHWSLMDNFEWNSGYFERFGLIYINYETLARIPKDSARYYSDIINNNGSNLEEPWVIY